MSESVAATNTPVGSETAVTSKSNSAVTFSDMEDLENAEVRAKREKAKEAKGERAKAERAESGKDGTGPLDTGKDKPKKDSVPKAKADQKESRDENDDEGHTEQEKKVRPSKVHKFRSGDSEAELAGDAIVTVTIDGKQEDVPLQELLNNYSGKVDYSKKYGEFGKEKDKFTREKAELDGFVGEFFRRSKEDPDTAWDLLAEASGKDPLEFKEAMIRSHLAELEPIFQMDEDARESWLRERKLTWKEKLLNNRDKIQNEGKQKIAQEQEAKNVREAFGFDDEAWADNYKLARQWTGGKDPTPVQVAAASRYKMVFEAVKNSAPDLEKHPKYVNLVEDYVADLMKTPSISQAQLEKLIAAVWGENDSNLKKVSKKVLERSESEGTDLRKAKAKKDEALFFSDI